MQQTNKLLNCLDPSGFCARMMRLIATAQREQHSCRDGKPDPGRACRLECAAAALGGATRRQNVVDQEDSPARDLLRTAHREGAAQLA